MKRFRRKKNIKSVFEKTDDKKSALKSTLRRIVCYRCGCAGGTLIKHSIGYCHQDPRICAQNLKRINLWKEFERTKERILKRRSHLDYKVLAWLYAQWQEIWEFFRQEKWRICLRGGRVYGNEKG